MLKSDKVILGILCTLLFIIPVCIILRANEIWPMGYEKLDTKAEYTKIICYNGPKEVNTLTSEEDIKDCLDHLSGIQTRESDWYDYLKSLSKKMLGSPLYRITLVKKDKSKKTIDIPSQYTKNADMDYIGQICEYKESE